MPKKRDHKSDVPTPLEPSPPMPKAMGKSTWKLLDRAATIGAGVLAQRATMVAWRGLTGAKPPASGRHPDVKTSEAVLWAAVAGGLTELVRTGVHRGVARYWVRSTGQLPPGMRPLTKPPTLPDEVVHPDDDAVATSRKQAKKRKGKG